MIREQAPYSQQLKDQPQDLARLFFEVSMQYPANVVQQALAITRASLGAGVTFSQDTFSQAADLIISRQKTIENAHQARGVSVNVTAIKIRDVFGEVMNLSHILRRIAAKDATVLNTFDQKMAPREAKYQQVRLLKDAAKTGNEHEYYTSMAYEAVKEISRQMGVTISDLLPREPDIYEPDEYR